MQSNALIGDKVAGRPYCNRRVTNPCEQEWFIAHLEVIEQAIELIINGEILNYKFDAENLSIVGR